MGRFLHTCGDTQGVFVPDAWEIESMEPLTYKSVGRVSAFHMFSVVGGWHIEDPYECVVAQASSCSKHPTTVHPCEWMILKDGEYVYSDLVFRHSLWDTTSEYPVRMELLGQDFFMHHKVTKPIWFINPIDGAVIHSGSKRKRHRYGYETGKRYCSECCRCFSSNNWTVQHMTTCHPTFAKAQDSLTDIVMDSLSR
jgi:hypothetical protein